MFEAKREQTGDVIVRRPGLRAFPRQVCEGDEADANNRGLVKNPRRCRPSWDLICIKAAGFGFPHASIFRGWMRVSGCSETAEMH